MEGKTSWAEIPVWNRYVVVDFLPPKKFHSQKAARQKMRHGARWKESRSLRFSMVTSSFANLCSESCCSHGGSLSSSAHWQLIWHGPLNKWTHILPHDDAILYSKYYNYCFCLLIYILQHYYPIKTRDGFGCIAGGGRLQWPRYVLPPNKNWQPFCSELL